MSLKQPLQPFQQRVVEEKTELDAKLAKLTTFFDTPVFLQLDIAEQHRLTYQKTAMTEYSRILGQRIAAFEG